jgi:hypothetical protein
MMAATKCTHLKQQPRQDAIVSQLALGASSGAKGSFCKQECALG